jgi:hypothetical protein
MAVPLSQLEAIDPDESTQEGIGDWHHSVSLGYWYGILNDALVTLVGR